MRPIKHLNTKYLFNRFKVYVYSKKYKNAPWLTPDMIRFLDSWLKDTDIGLEFGSGRSTVWFASRISFLYSVEENISWAKNVQKILEENRIRHKVDYRYFSINGNDHNNPHHEYLSVIDDIPDSSLDFCLIDGALREYCALYSIRKIKPGGLLIIDDIERYFPRKEKSHSPNARSLSDGFSSEDWEKFGNEVSDWRIFWTSSGVTDTAFWVKPLLKE